MEVGWALQTCQATSLDCPVPAQQSCIGISLLWSCHALRELVPPSGSPQPPLWRQGGAQPLRVVGEWGGASATDAAACQGRQRYIPWLLWQPGGRQQGGEATLGANTKASRLADGCNRGNPIPTPHGLALVIVTPSPRTLLADAVAFCPMSPLSLPSAALMNCVWQDGGINLWLQAETNQSLY